MEPLAAQLPVFIAGLAALTVGGLTVALAWPWLSGGGVMTRRIEAYQLHLHLPGGPGVRLDSHAYTGYVIPPFYDSLMGKLIVNGVDREEALARMSRALEEFIVGGIETTIPLHQRLLRDGRFQNGGVDIHFLERFLGEE